MKKVYEDSQYMIVRKKPTLTDLIQTKLRPASLHEKLRWIVQYVFGYYVYVLIELKNGGG